MNNYLFLLGSTLSSFLILLSSCGSDTIASKAQKENTSLVLSMEMHADEFRAIQFTDESRDDKNPTIQLPTDKKLKSYCFIRKGPDIGYTELEWTADDGAYKSGANPEDVKKYKLKTAIKTPEVIFLKPGGGSLTLTDSDDQWEMLVVLGGGSLNTTGGNLKLDFLYNDKISNYETFTDNNRNKILDVPFSSGWKCVKVKTKTIGTRQKQFVEGSFSMKPLGILIRAKLTNPLDRSAVLSGLVFTSSDISADGSFDLTQEEILAGRKQPKWSRARGNRTVYEYPLNVNLLPKNGQSTSSISCLFWGMPTTPDNQEKTFMISAYDFKIKRKGDPDGAAPYSFSTAKHYSGGRLITPEKGVKMPAGKIYRANMEIIRYKTAIEYVGGYNVSRIKRVLVKTNASVRPMGSGDDDATGYYDARAVIATPDDYLPDGYHLPSLDEFLSLVPAVANKNILGFNPNGPVLGRVQTTVEPILINGEKNTFSAQYKIVNEDPSASHKDRIVVYALRFMKGTQDTPTENAPKMPDNSKMAAYMYEICRNTSATLQNPNGWTLRITSRFLGEQSKTIDDINRAFFSVKDSKNDFSIEIPWVGYATEEQGDPIGVILSNMGSSFYLLDRSPKKSDGQYIEGRYTDGYIFYQMETSAGLGVVGAYSNQYPAIRPFRNNLE